MIEVHPFGEFVPKNSRYLLLGSFVARPVTGYDWFYSNGRNQFWPILEEVYGLKLVTKNQQQKLFEGIKMVLADVILSCERVNNSNLDINLTNIVYNLEGIGRIFEKNGIERVYFTSRFVEGSFLRQFRDIAREYSKENLIYLPSPSPRNAGMSKQEKVRKYKELLPKLF